MSSWIGSGQLDDDSPSLSHDPRKVRRGSLAEVDYWALGAQLARQRVESARQVRCVREVTSRLQGIFSRPLLGQILLRTREKDKASPSSPSAIPFWQTIISRMDVDRLSLIEKVGTDFGAIKHNPDNHNQISPTQSTANPRLLPAFPSLISASNCNCKSFEA